MVLVDILFAKFTEHFTQSVLNSYLRLLPVNLQQKNARFLRWQDKHSHLIGKLLLDEGLKQYGYKKTLTELKYSPFGRPYLNESVDFNISHSGNYVICAIANNARLGIDIEKVEKIDCSDFINILRTEEWEDIVNSTDPAFTFFQYWAMKESVIKAEGKGLSIPLKSICIKNKEARFNGKIWFLRKLPIDKNYSCYLAINDPDFDVRICEIGF
jgi:4'-phosphopantetheinyl transferase